MQSKFDILQLVDSFQRNNIIVIGDVMVDTYLVGTINKVSPEASIPVLKVVERTNRLGGAANVALNLKSLGANSFLFSIIGKDKKAEELLSLLKDERISSSGILQSSNRKTTTKFRVIQDQTQLIRMDEEDTHDISSDEEMHLLKGIEALINKQAIDAILIQDYNKGVLTKFLIGKIIALAKKHHILITIDPKKDHFFEYQEVDLFKPNLKELSAALDKEINPTNTQELEQALREIKAGLRAKCVLSTLSEYGNAILSKEFIYTECYTQEITDVSGAGDTVISIASLCLINQVEDKMIAELSNIAGILVCKQMGVVPIKKDQFLAACLQILSPIEYAK